MPARNNVESTLRLHRVLRKDLAAVEKRLKNVEKQLSRVVFNAVERVDTKPLMVRWKKA
mgnify:CR=1 FL=1